MSRRNPVDRLISFWNNFISPVLEKVKDTQRKQLENYSAVQKHRKGEIELHDLNETQKEALLKVIRGEGQQDFREIFEVTPSEYKDAAQAVLKERVEVLENFGKNLGVDGESLIDLAGEIEIIDTAEAAVGGAIGGAVSYAMYQALKEILHLEGARRRGEISKKKILQRVIVIALKSSKKGVIAGAIFGVAIIIFDWILIPLALLSPLLGFKMIEGLWRAFWEGLDYEQRQEILGQANQLGGNVSRFFLGLENPEQKLAIKKTKVFAYVFKNLKSIWPFWQKNKAV